MYQVRNKHKIVFMRIIKICNLRHLIRHKNPKVHFLSTEIKLPLKIDKISWITTFKKSIQNKYILGMISLKRPKISPPNNLNLQLQSINRKKSEHKIFIPFWLKVDLFNQTQITWVKICMNTKKCQMVFNSYNLEIKDLGK